MIVTIWDREVIIYTGITLIFQRTVQKHLFIADTRVYIKKKLVQLLVL